MNDQEKKYRKHFTPLQALQKIEAWCAFQERCQQEVRDKLYDFGVYGDDAENVIAELISRNFIDEERFARSFARGKFRIKKWGRIRIRRELKLKKISDYCIRKGLSEIDEDEYRETIRKVIAAKSKTVKEKHPLKKKYKIMTYAVSRGFEQDIVREMMNDDELFPGD